MRRRSRSLLPAGPSVIPLLSWSGRVQAAWGGSTFLRDPTQIGEVTPAVGGALGSYALVGVLVGPCSPAPSADVIGRRKVMLLAYAWFSVGMGVTALMDHRDASG